LKVAANLRAYLQSVIGSPNNPRHCEGRKARGNPVGAKAPLRAHWIATPLARLAMTRWIDWRGMFFFTRTKFHYFKRTPGAVVVLRGK
jgi:hypothetical protein